MGRPENLGDWKIEVYREAIDNSAEVHLWHNDHGAHVKLNKEFAYKPERIWLDRLALHEVCHILLCDLSRLTKDRYTTPDAIETAEHAVVRRLENALTKGAA